MYKGFYLEVEEDRDDDVIKRFHYAVSAKSGKWYPIHWSPYSDPDQASFERMVDEIILLDFVHSKRDKTDVTLG